MNRKSWLSYQTNRIRWEHLGFWLVGLLFSGPVTTAQDIYVDPGVGTRENSGTQPILLGEQRGPVSTVTQALRMVPAGGRVILLPTGVPLREEIRIVGTLTHGYDGVPIIIEGNGSDLVGYRPLLPNEFQSTLSGMMRGLLPPSQHTLLWQGDQLLTWMHSAAHQPLRKLAAGEYTLWHGQLWFQPEQPVTEVTNTLAISDLKCGIFIYAADHVVIRNLRIRGFALDGIQIRGPVRSVRFEDCEIRDNGRAGVALRTNTKVTFVNCLVVNNGQMGVLAENYAKVDLVASKVIQSPKLVVQDKTSQVQTSGTFQGPPRLEPTTVPGSYLRLIGNLNQLQSTIPSADLEASEPMAAPAAPADADPSKPAKNFDDFFGGKSETGSADDFFGPAKKAEPMKSTPSDDFFGGAADTTPPPPATPPTATPPSATEPAPKPVDPFDFDD